MVFEQVCSDLEAEGYEVQPFVIPACGVGAPHRRDRVWFVAYTKNTHRVRCDGDKSEEKPCAGGFGKFSAGDYVRICGAAGTSAHRADARFEAMREWADSVHAAESAADTTSFENIRWGQSRFLSELTGIVATGDVAYANGKRRLKLQSPAQPVQTQEWYSQYGDAKPRIPDWKNFPTESPVCGRDDGISARLDGITFPAWCGRSIKAYGNAIVPQVALQLFKTINEYELLIHGI